MIHFDIQKAFGDIGRTLANNLGYDYILNGYDDNGQYGVTPKNSFVRLDTLWNEKDRTTLDNGSGSLANHPLQVMIMVAKSSGGNVSFKALADLAQAQAEFYEGLELATAKVFKTFPSPLLTETTSTSGSQFDTHIGYALTVQIESIE